MQHLRFYQRLVGHLLTQDRLKSLALPQVSVRKPDECDHVAHELFSCLAHGILVDHDLLGGIIWGTGLFSGSMSKAVGSFALTSERQSSVCPDAPATRGLLLEITSFVAHTNNGYFVLIIRKPRLDANDEINNV